MATYYVRQDGNNLNTGLGPSAAEALQTITAGCAKITAAGDILYIAPGKYYEGSLIPNSDGAAGNLVRIIGDPWAEQFVDVDPGVVLIDGRDPTNYVGPIDRSYAFQISSRAYLSFENMHYANIVFCYGRGNYNEFHNIILDGKKDFAIYQEDSTITVINQKFEDCYCGSINFLNVTGLQVNRCIILGGMNSSNRGSTITLTITDSIILGNIYIYDSDQTIIMTAKGSQFLRGDDANGCVRIGTDGTGNNFDGCYFEGVGSIPYGLWIYHADSSPEKDISIRGCTFNNFTYGLAVDNDNFSTSDDMTITDNEFLNSDYGLYIIDNHGDCRMSSCNFENIKSYATRIEVEYTSQPITYSGNTYKNIGNTALHTGSGFAQITESSRTDGPITRKTGFFIDELAPISGLKSLNLKGYTRFPAYVVFVPCEVGKEKKVKFKSKKSSVGIGVVNARLGTTVIEIPDTTDIETNSISYTHYKTEYVPMLIYGNIVSNVYTLTIDDIEY